MTLPFASSLLYCHRYVDCDVLVSEVRETSRKPDEMYSLLERLSPGTRKLEVGVLGGFKQRGFDNDLKDVLRR